MKMQPHVPRGVSRTRRQVQKIRRTHRRLLGLCLGWLCLACWPGCSFSTRELGASLPTDGGGGIDLVRFDQFQVPETGPLGPCTNLRCQQTTCTSGACKVPACTGGTSTTVTGTVMDPAGKVPLYNVYVYVPNQALSELSEGPSCDICANATSGDPIATAQTDAQGGFTLQNVPVGADIPLVIQAGKWRRETTIPSVAACANTAITDVNVTRLPRNQNEGHIPKIALTTGGADALECLLRKIGLEDSEFTPESGAGRVNLFAGGNHNGTAMSGNSRGTNSYLPTLNGGATFTDAETWWDVATNVVKYDIVLHSCEGVENPTNKSTAARQALQSYADAGGRVFTSHWHNYWIEHGPAPWPTVATFHHLTNGVPATVTASVDQTFPKGVALAQWLVNVGASTVLGQLPIQGNKHTVDAVNAAVAQQWIYNDAMTPMGVEYLSFLAPVQPAAGVPQCGKVVFSDLHVSSGAGGSDASAPAKPFPSGCVTTDLTPQEKALEFMLFDLSSCVEPTIP
jgi:hypothetical protein